MALENSGTMSIGGSTAGRSINLELGKSATATSGLGDADFRTLADVASGAISMSDFYGASSYPFSDNLFLALPFTSNLNDVSNSINSNSTTKTATSSSVDISSTQSKFGSNSAKWNASSDSLKYAEQGNELVFGTGDFCIETWLYDDGSHNGTNGRCYIFDNRLGGSVVGDPPTMVGHCDGHNEFTFYDGDSEITYSVSTTGSWIHYAVSREGTTTRMFIDGTLRGSSTSSTNFTNNGISVGRATDNNYGWAGYMQDFRVYKGVAKYTSNFTPVGTNPY